MNLTLRSSQHDQLEERSATAAGRFERQLLTIESADPELAPVRSDKVARMQARVRYYDYKIDPLVLAEAIIDRVCLR
jgi:anti-sigma28 factor (negative regulator of flagellin synthesis)